MNQRTNEIAAYLLENMKDPFPQYILRKEILRKPDTETLSFIKQSKWYMQLEGEQQEDGSYGRFHTMDSFQKGKKVFHTTEEAMRRMCELDIPKNDKIVINSIHLLERYLKGMETWTDLVEKHHDDGKSFCHARNYINAANLCRLDPDHSLLSEPREVCVNQLKTAFASGFYDDKVWRKMNLNYSGTCLSPFMVYILWLLQGTDHISEDLQRKYLTYIWNREAGIYYISDMMPSAMISCNDKNFTSWLSELEVLSGFSLFPEFINDEMQNHLYNEIERLMTGEVVLPTARPIVGHYSESWRDKNARKNDLILRILRVLKKVEGAQ